MRRRHKLQKEMFLTCTFVINTHKLHVANSHTDMHRVYVCCLEERTVVFGDSVFRGL